MGRLTPDVAVARLDKLADDLGGFPAASQRSKAGTPSTIEFLGQWSLRVSRGDMSPDAVPALLDRQATRHAHGAPRVAAIIEAAEAELRAIAGTSYGAPWYYGPS